MGTRPARGKEHKPFLVLDLIAAVAALALTVVVAVIQRIIEIFVVILIAIHIITVPIPLDNSFAVGIAAVSAFVGIVRVFRAGLGVGTVAEFACL